MSTYGKQYQWFCMNGYRTFTTTTAPPIPSPVYRYNAVAFNFMASKLGEFNLCYVVPGSGVYMVAYKAPSGGTAVRMFVNMCYNNWLDEWIYVDSTSNNVYIYEGDSLMAGRTPNALFTLPFNNLGLDVDPCLFVSCIDHIGFIVQGEKVVRINMVDGTWSNDTSIAMLDTPPGATLSNQIKWIAPLGRQGLIMCYIEGTNPGPTWTTKLIHITGPGVNDKTVTTSPSNAWVLHSPGANVTDIDVWWKAKDIYTTAQLAPSAGQVDEEYLSYVGTMGNRWYKTSSMGGTQGDIYSVQKVLSSGNWLGNWDSQIGTVNNPFEYVHLYTTLNSTSNCNVPYMTAPDCMQGIPVVDGAGNYISPPNGFLDAMTAYPPSSTPSSNYNITNALDRARMVFGQGWAEDHYNNSDRDAVLMMRNSELWTVIADDAWINTTNHAYSSTSVKMVGISQSDWDGNLACDRIAPI